MANLLATSEGRLMLQRITSYLGERRMSRRLKRAFYIAFKNYEVTGAFDQATLLNNLNSLDQDEVLAIGRMLGDMGLFELSTQSDMSIYVDGTAGSDVTGDGSTANPYQTLEFLNDRMFPKFINHKVRILLATDVSNADQIAFSQVLGPNGSLTVAGIGNATVVSTSVGAGPFSLVAVGRLGPPNVAFQFQVAETFIVDELYGKWIRFRDGFAAGQCMPLHDNIPSTLWTRGGWDESGGGIAPGDTFDFIEPPVTLTAPGFYSGLRGPDSELAMGNYGSSFNLLNLTVDISGGQLQDRKFHIRNEMESQISFVTVRNSGAAGDASYIDSDLNYRSSKDPDSIALLNTDIVNMNAAYTFGTSPVVCSGLLFYNSSWPPISFGSDQLVIDGGRIYAIDARGRITIRGSQKVAQHVRVCGFDNPWVNGNTGVSLDYNYFAGKPTGSTLTINRATIVELKGNYFKAGQDCIGVNFGDIILDDNLVSAADYTGYGLAVHGFTRTWMFAAPVITGVSGDIRWDGGAGTVAWPIVNNTQANALGSFVTWV